MNHEIEEIIEKDNIVRFIKTMKIGWYDRVFRREKKVLRTITELNQSYGRSRK